MGRMRSHHDNEGRWDELNTVLETLEVGGRRGGGTTGHSQPSGTNPDFEPTLTYIHIFFSFVFSSFYFYTSSYIQQTASEQRRRVYILPTYFKSITWILFVLTYKLVFPAYTKASAPGFLHTCIRTYHSTFLIFSCHGRTYLPI